LSDYSRKLGEMQRKYIYCFKLFAPHRGVHLKSTLGQ